MVFIKRFALILVVGIFVFLAFKRVQPEQALESQPSTPTVFQSESVEESPYSIASLRARTFPEGKLTVERTIRETDQFVSQVVSYDSDGLKQFALLNIPNNNKPAAGFPVVIVNHGYIDPAIYSTTGNYINTSAFYASQGFAVLKPDYRGHDQSQGEAGTFFSRINYAIDVISLIKSIDSMPDLDSRNVFAYGHSMGGDVTLRVLESTQLLRAASLWAPAVTDFPENQLYFARRNNVSRRYERYLEELQSTLSEDEYPTVSTVENLHLVEVPLLIHHGTRDESVPYEWGTTLHDRLKEKGKEITLYTYAGDNHDISGHFSQALMRDVEFFRQHLVSQ